MIALVAVLTAMLIAVAACVVAGMADDVDGGNE